MADILYNSDIGNIISRSLSTGGSAMKSRRSHTLWIWTPLFFAVLALAAIAVVHAPAVEARTAGSALGSQDGAGSAQLKPACSGCYCVCEVPPGGSGGITFLPGVSPSACTALVGGPCTVSGQTGSYTSCWHGNVMPPFHCS
jgi:hypothetical protein